MRRALSKPHLRVAAVDDGRFSRRQRRAPIAAVIWSSPGRWESVAAGWVTRDGTDATERIGDLLEECPGFAGVRVVLLDGIAVGGFNIVDLRALARRLRRPVLAVTRRAPDLPAIRRALVRYFPDADRRWRRLRRVPLREARGKGRPLQYAAVDCPAELAEVVLARARGAGRWPEPLRLAHLVAAAVAQAHDLAGRTVKRRAPVAPSAGL